VQHSTVARSGIIAARTESGDIMGHQPDRERSSAELAVLGRLRKLCVPLPGVTEQRDGFGHTTLRVGKKSFAILGEQDGIPSLALKADLHTQAALVKRSAFYKTPYVGQHGWVSVDGGVKELDWATIEEILNDAYRAIAPKKLLKQLGASG
jgi:predicted DNA-binding protein (MmcQ/YjbR family)